MSTPSYPPANAPYAQAAAVVNEDGTIVRAQGVAEVRRIADGSYVVRVSKGIDLEKGVPVVCLIGRTDSSVPGQIYVNLHDTGGDPHTFGVMTYAGAARVNSSFTVIVA
ncbi:hypothetical protein ACFU53_40830 [Streptomyces sp. NPDC057474]|uniref:hypothetical protein n=1 Tax=Streptomyces sp. NPDC057474 TaxID=3346144 RepID=UPI0036B489FE